MAGKKAGGENTKKVAGNAKKAEAAAQKNAVEEGKKSKVEEEEWSKGAKSNKKQEVAAEKAADAARKKAERDALLKEEEASLPSKPIRTTKGAAPKPSAKSHGLDLSSLDDAAGPTTLNATGIDNALDALSLTTSSANQKVERHPERRYPAAFKAYEERRFEEVKRENPGLRRNQVVEVIRKEFEKSEENPFNQVHGTYDMSKDEAREVRAQERERIEARLAGT